MPLYIYIYIYIFTISIKNVPIRFKKINDKKKQLYYLFVIVSSNKFESRNVCKPPQNTTDQITLNKISNWSLFKFIFSDQTLIILK